MDYLVYLLAGLVTVGALSAFVAGVAAIAVAFRKPSARSAPVRVPEPRPLAAPEVAPSPAPRHRAPEPAR